MTTWQILVASAAGLAVVAAQALSQPDDDKHQPDRGVFHGLKVGQFVMVEDLGTVFEIRTLDAKLPTGMTLIEIGEDYLTVQDVSAVKEMRIPIYAIKAVVHVRTKPKGK